MSGSRKGPPTDAGKEHSDEGPYDAPPLVSCEYFCLDCCAGCEGLVEALAGEHSAHRLVPLAGGGEGEDSESRSPVCRQMAGLSLAVACLREVEETIRVHRQSGALAPGVAEPFRHPLTSEQTLRLGNDDVDHDEDTSLLDTLLAEYDAKRQQVAALLEEMRALESRVAAAAARKAQRDCACHARTRQYRNETLPALWRRARAAQTLVEEAAAGSAHPREGSCGAGDVGGSGAAQVQQKPTSLAAVQAQCRAEAVSEGRALAARALALVESEFAALAAAEERRRARFMNAVDEWRKLQQAGGEGEREAAAAEANAADVYVSRFPLSEVGRQQHQVHATPSSTSDKFRAHNTTPSASRCTPLTSSYSYGGAASTAATTNAESATFPSFSPSSAPPVSGHEAGAASQTTASHSASRAAALAILSFAPANPAGLAKVEETASVPAPQSSSPLPAKLAPDREYLLAELQKLTGCS